MTALARPIVIAHRLLVDVPDRERCVDGIERLNHGATILGHPLALEPVPAHTPAPGCCCMSLTLQAALALALQCAPAIDPHMIVAIGQHESGLDPLTIHDNTTGQSLHGEVVIVAAAQLIAAGHSVDLGLMQINSHNLDLLRLPLRDAFAACRSIEAAARLLALFSRYNTGSPTMGVSKALTRMLKLRQTGRAAA